MQPDRPSRRELLEFSARARGIDAHYQRALTMLTSPAVRKAFDLSRGAGRACATATAGRPTARAACWPGGWSRRGRKFVNVYFAATIGGQGDSGGWDTHGFNNKPMYPILKNYLLPITDQTLPTLLEDLDGRGLLDDDAGGLGGRVRPVAAHQQAWPAATTGRSATRRCWPAAASSAATSTAPRTSIGAYPATRPGAARGPVGDDVPPARHRPARPRSRDALNRPLPISPGQ